METTLRELQRQRPFRPIKIELSNGEWIQVHHPELMMTDAERLYVLLPGEKLARWISMLHVRQVKEIESEADRE